MIAREDGTFLGVANGSVVTRYVWEAPHKIDVTLEHGFIRGLHAWFEIEAGRRRHARHARRGGGFRLGTARLDPRRC